MTVTALVPWVTIEDAVTRGNDLGIRVCVDLFNVSDPVAMARRAERTGAGAAMVHVGVDQRRHDPHYSQLDALRQVAGSLSIPVAYATYDVDEAVAAVAAGASEIVQGTPLIEADDPRAALAAFIARVKGLDAGPATEEPQPSEPRPRPRSSTRHSPGGYTGPDEASREAIDMVACRIVDPTPLITHRSAFLTAQEGRETLTDSASRAI